MITSPQTEQYCTVFRFESMRRSPKLPLWLLSMARYAAVTAAKGKFLSVNPQARWIHGDERKSEKAVSHFNN